MIPSMIGNYYELINQLPSNGTLILHGITWEEYEELLERFNQTPHLRFTYDQGTLSIMPISQEHDLYKDFIHDLVRQLSVELRLPLRSFGSGTIRKESIDRGTEPDCSFYIQSLPLIGQKKKPDFQTDPPPDLVVEVDISHSSLAKLPLYAKFGIPEIWVYDEQKLSIYCLEDHNYVPAFNSRALPMLNQDILTHYLSLVDLGNETEVLIRFIEWIRSQKHST